MSVIIIEGPEKAGKSTLAGLLRMALMRTHLHDSVIIRHQAGRADPDDRVYSKQLMDDTSAPPDELVVIWDRGWPSEYVYGNLLGQPRRLAKDPWLGEWLHGRAVQANGLRVMLLGPGANELRRRRDDTDLPVDPQDEKTMYTRYGKRYGWTTLPTFSSVSTGMLPLTAEDHAQLVCDQFELTLSKKLGAITPLPPVYCGPINARVVVVGEQRSDTLLGGGWLPFTSRMTTILGRLFGDRAFDVGWTNAHDCPPSSLREARTFITCGEIAHRWVEGEVLKGGQEEVRLPHASHAFRFNNSIASEEHKSIIQTIRQTTRSLSDGSKE
jgi:hypothetical protein